MRYFFAGLERHWLYFSRKPRFWIFVVLVSVGAFVCAGIGVDQIRFLSWMTGRQALTQPYSVSFAIASYKGFMMAVFPVLFFASLARSFPADVFMVNRLVVGGRSSAMDRLSLYAIFVFCAVIALTAGFVVFQLFLAARFSFAFLDLQFKMYIMLVLYAILFCSVSLLSVTLFRNPVVRSIFALIVWISILVFFRYADFARSPYFSVAREWNFFQMVVLCAVSSLCLLGSFMAHRVFRLNSSGLIDP
jgi:hypothetical protein